MPGIHLSLYKILVSRLDFSLKCLGYSVGYGIADCRVNYKFIIILAQLASDFSAQFDISCQQV